MTITVMHRPDEILDSWTARVDEKVADLQSIGYQASLQFTTHPVLAGVISVSHFVRDVRAGGNLVQQLAPAQEVLAKLKVLYERRAAGVIASN